ncbi:MAG: TIGR03088 family PEP-CTERM/XrtA system glycosyltransferase [Burkholderiaceae bacterium]
MDPRPLIAHVLYRFDTGGLENGVVNLINRLPADRWRHAVIALTEVTEFRRRIERPDVEFVSLHKGEGHGLKLTPRLVREFGRLRPAIVHTRNLAALEASFAAAIAGVPARVHGEHGWDVSDLSGKSARHRLIRRLYRPCVSRYIALSRHLATYLREQVGVAPGRISQIYNGVDTRRFHPAEFFERPSGCPFEARHFVVGSVGRLEVVKDQLTLARAFVAAVQGSSAARERLRLAIVGAGSQRAAIESVLAQAGLLDLAWLPGERHDIPAVLRGLDGFVLPSLMEGISNTILEAQASALPVAATAVGGNLELVAEGLTGRRVPPADPAALAAVLLQWLAEPDTARALGRRARAAVESDFAIERMVADYDRVYRSLLSPQHASALAGASEA